MAAPDDQYEVLVVRYGTRVTTRSEVFLNYAIYGQPDAPIGMDYFFWIARNRYRSVVVDTGFSLHGGQSRNRTQLVDPTLAFTLLGIDPAARPTVVATHAHYDHIGNLAFFPDSPIVVAQRELDFWSGHVAEREQFRFSVENDELRVLASAADAGRVQAFAQAITVAPGIEAIELGGHTPGQTVVVIQTSAGPVLLASDVLHYYEELERGLPFSLTANLVELYGAFDRIAEMVRDGTVAHVVSGHDPVTLQRFDPLPNTPPPLQGHVGVIGAMQ